MPTPGRSAHLARVCFLNPRPPYRGRRHSALRSQPISSPKNRDRQGCRSHLELGGPGKVSASGTTRASTPERCWINHSSTLTLHPFRRRTATSTPRNGPYGAKELFQPHPRTDEREAPHRLDQTRGPRHRECNPTSTTRRPRSTLRLPLPRRRTTQRLRHTSAARRFAPHVQTHPPRRDHPPGHGNNYSLPRHNPFVAGSYAPDLAYGFRNPWRLASPPRPPPLVARTARLVGVRLRRQKCENYGWVLRGRQPFQLAASSVRRRLSPSRPPPLRAAPHRRASITQELPT